MPHGAVDFFQKHLSAISLKWKVNLMVIFLILLYTGMIYVIILPYLEQEKIVERQGKLRAVVNSAVSIMDSYERALRNQTYKSDPSMPQSMADAQNRVIKTLRAMRYDKTEYFFILDSDGRLLMHPTKPELEGLNLLNVRDPQGRPVFRELVLKALRDNEAFVSYRWQSKYSPVIFEPQITYAQYYWPWGWIVCSSLYTQDIVEAMRAIRLRSLLYDAFAAVLALAGMLLLFYWGISRPLDKLLAGIHAVHDGDLDYRVVPASQDELGYISQEFNWMVSDLQSSRDSLVRSETKYREFTNLLPDIIYECDADLRVTYFNQAGYQLTGYSAEDVAAGLSIGDLVTPEDRLAIVNLVQQSDARAIKTTHKIIGKDGQIIFGENYGIIAREGAETVGLKGSIRDVTEKIKFQEQIVQTQKMDTIGTLAGGLAHDFNNALTGIVSTLSLIRYELETDVLPDREWLAAHLTVMEKSSKRAVDMVKQLLTLSRKRETESKLIDLNATIRDVVGICANTLDKSIVISVEALPEMAVIKGDPTQIEQVLLNLCVNAAHAMTFMRPKDAPAGGRLLLSLEHLRADEPFCALRPQAKQQAYWKLSVRDTGVGMSAEILAKIFTPFFTTKDKGLGTGLGLAMVYTICQQHGGFVEVSSEVGVGTNFDVFLPMAGADGVACEDEQPVAIPHGAGLILVVDDEESLRTLAKVILEKCGYTVIVAADGEEGLRLFNERRAEIRAILTDLVMPRMAGDQFFRELRKLDPAVRVLLTSGFKQDERVSLALASGLNGFVQKPYTLKSLALAVAELLKG